MSFSFDASINSQANPLGLSFILQPYRAVFWRLVRRRLEYLVEWVVSGADGHSDDSRDNDDGGIEGFGLLTPGTAAYQSSLQREDPFLNFIFTFPLSVWQASSARYRELAQEQKVTHVSIDSSRISSLISFDVPGDPPSSPNPPKNSPSSQPTYTAF